MTFKVGDRVRRTVFDGSGYDHKIHGKPGVVYTLTHVSKHSLTGIDNGLTGVADDGSILDGASPGFGAFELVRTKPATNDQIVAEAMRRFNDEPGLSKSTASYIIEVVREGWVPKPVPADLLAGRQYAASRYPRQADRYNSGQYDNGTVKSFVAGAAWRKANPTA